jgi:hypothetical protein
MNTEGSQIPAVDPWRPGLHGRPDTFGRAHGAVPARADACAARARGVAVGGCGSGCGCGCGSGEEVAVDVMTV